MTTAINSTTIPVADLSFDRNNPRLAEYGITPQTSDEELIKVLWDAMDVKELVQSIAASGFFPHETLIVASEQNQNVVIEGNRRLAAVKVLLDPSIVETNGWTVPVIPAEARLQLNELPVTISPRQDAWRFLGFKHVNGPAKWSSYAKAKYIADVHRKYSISLADIANQIGDGHRTVQRLYRGLMVIEQAEREKVYSRDDRSKQHFSFSHLYTGLEYDGISSFLSLRAESEEAESPVPQDKLPQLGEFCVWLYGSKKRNKTPVVQTQSPHLSQLNEVLKSREATAALREENDLSIAFEISRPPVAVFEEALLTAKRQLQRARANMTTGDDNSEELLRIAESIANLADDIYTEMERKRNPLRRTRRSEV